MPLSPEQRTLLAEQFTHLPTEMPAGQTAVYTLSDPRTHVIRYVGVTRYLHKRLILHVKRLPVNGEKRTWILELAAHGLIPTMTLIETVKGSAVDALRREQRWIARYTAEGAPLLNREVLHPRNRLAQDNLVADKAGHTRHQEEGDSKILTCERQIEIPWFDGKVTALRAEDGSIGVTLRSLCNVLGLHYSGQVERIQRRVEITAGLLAVRIQTSGGPQIMHALSLRVIPFWVLMIAETRVYDRVRVKLLRFA